MSKARGLADLGNVYSDGALSNRNVIINGGMQVDQRNGGAAVTVSSDAVTYIVDRMTTYNGTGTGAIAAQQSTVGNQSSAKMTATSPITDLSGTKRLHGPTTKVEGFDCYHLNGSVVTISFTVETNWTGNLGINLLKMPSIAKSYVVDVPVTSGVNNVSVTVTLEADTVPTNDNASGLYLSIGSQNEGTLATATTGSWVSGDYRATTSTTPWAKTTGNFINVTNLQLEAGDQSTPFEHRSYADELARCQRYYQTSGGLTHPHVVPFNSYNAYGGKVTFITTMRAPPTMVSVSSRYYDGSWNTPTASAFSGTLAGSTLWRLNGSFTAYVPRLGELNWTADAEL